MFCVFLMWTIFKLFIEFVPTFFLFYALVFFGWKAHEILTPQPGVECNLLHWKWRVPTDGLPGKSLCLLFNGPNSEEKLSEMACVLS